jgi:hypothetical protein
MPVFPHAGMPARRGARRRLTPPPIQEKPRWPISAGAATMVPSMPGAGLATAWGACLMGPFGSFFSARPRPAAPACTSRPRLCRRAAGVLQRGGADQGGKGAGGTPVCRGACPPAPELPRCTLVACARTPFCAPARFHRPPQPLPWHWPATGRLVAARIERPAHGARPLASPAAGAERILYPLPEELPSPEKQDFLYSVRRVRFG